MSARSLRRRLHARSALSPYLLLVVLLPLVAALFVGCGSGRTGRLAPGFVGTTLEGAKVSLSEYRGKPVVLAFMASW